jgi:hypothetical protein
MIEKVDKVDIIDRVRANKSLRVLRFLTIAAAILTIFALLADTSFAQCVMCRASINSNSSFIRSFNIGVLVLLVPPVSIFCTIFIIAIRHRRQ